MAEIILNGHQVHNRFFLLGQHPSQTTTRIEIYISRSRKSLQYYNFLSFLEDILLETHHLLSDWKLPETKRTH